MDPPLQTPETPPPRADEICDNVMTDPPPPYPDPTRPRRQHRGTRRPGSSPRLQTIQRLSSTDSYSDYEGGLRQNLSMSASSGPNTDDDIEGDERDRARMFLTPSPLLRTSNMHHHHHHHHDRQRARSVSQMSTLSAAPSLAQTVLSLFQVDPEDEEGGIFLPEEGIDTMADEHGDRGSLHSMRHEFSCFSLASWERYFRPMGRPLYWRALVHLLVINFPFALAAWVYLFVFTLTGTTTLVALPLGALLCFLNLLGARAFARAELELQTQFHSPLSYPTPYPPRPIFTRYRELTAQEIESGRMPYLRTGLVKERSFYKNAYSMFTDPTSYQALFYFIVIKPAITLGLLLFVLVFVLPCLVLVLPAPAALRAVRKLGKWQGNVAVEGLYYAVR
ncbi:hypothetical protein CC2G_009668 [Coprinopsis cinerea AmutBmut pab1-1]|nr:hypothetical protein CC2G_009668 [Coprinopsis cinerea AmutBmut pab1-1]